MVASYRGNAEPRLNQIEQGKVMGFSMLSAALSIEIHQTGYFYVAERCY